MAYLLDTNHCIFLKNAWVKSPTNRKMQETNVLNKASKQQCYMTLLWLVMITFFNYYTQT